MSEKIQKETQEKIHHLQMMQQSMQQFVMQKQQFQTQLVEIESALAEVDKTSEAYKIVGSILISAKKDELKAELENKKNILNIRIKSLEKQEEQLKSKSSSVQEEVLKEMKH